MDTSSSLSISCCCAPLPWWWCAWVAVLVFLALCMVWCPLLATLFSLSFYLNLLRDTSLNQMFGILVMVCTSNFGHVQLAWKISKHISYAMVWNCMGGSKQKFNFNSKPLCYFPFSSSAWKGGWRSVLVKYFRVLLDVTWKYRYIL